VDSYNILLLKDICKKSNSDIKEIIQDIEGVLFQIKDPVYSYEYREKLIESIVCLLYKCEYRGVTKNYHEIMNMLIDYQLQEVDYIKINDFFGDKYQIIGCALALNKLKSKNIDVKKCLYKIENFSYSILLKNSKQINTSCNPSENTILYNYGILPQNEYTIIKRYDELLKEYLYDSIIKVKKSIFNKYNKEYFILKNHKDKIYRKDILYTVRKNVYKEVKNDECPNIDKLINDLGFYGYTQLFSNYIQSSYDKEQELSRLLYKMKDSRKEIRL